MVNGGVFASLIIVTFSAWTSIVPVFRFGFIVPTSRATTVPTISSTNSLRIFSATSRASFDKSGLNTTWTIPERSRRSIKMSPPKSRRFCTHPFLEHHRKNMIDHTYYPLLLLTILLSLVNVCSSSVISLPLVRLFPCFLN
jgi:hypothetical protein